MVRVGVRVRVSFRNAINVWLLIRSRFKNLEKQPPSWKPTSRPSPLAMTLPIFMKMLKSYHSVITLSRVHHSGDEKMFSQNGRQDSIHRNDRVYVSLRNVNVVWAWIGRNSRKITLRFITFPLVIS